MNKNKVYLSIVIIMWILTIIPVLFIIGRSIEWSKGINVALEGIKMDYGMSAVWFMLSFDLVFRFPIYVIWIIGFIITIIMSVKYKNKKQNNL